MTDRKTISKRSVDAASVPPVGERRLWDDKLSGFCLRIYAASNRAKAGRKVYAVKYRVDRRQAWFTIGEHGQPFKTFAGRHYASLTAELARDEAELILAEAKRGQDPQALRERRREDLTVAQLIERYLEDGPKAKLTKRASSWIADRSNLTRHVQPLIGSRKLMDLTAEDVGGMLQRIINGDTAATFKTKARGKVIVKGGEGAASRVLAVTRAMFNWAISKKLMTGPNPCAKAKLSERSNPERFLSGAEAAKLLAVLSTLEDRGEIRKAQGDIFRLLLLTGARRDEIAALQWAHVNLDRGVIVLPPLKTKTGGTSGERQIALNKSAVEILKSQPRPEKAIYVFPASKGKSGHTTSSGKVWRTKVRPAANLDGFRIHDLRHSFASFALADGASLPLIGKALGHRNSRSTERYSHAALDPLKALAERVAGQLGPPTGNEP